MVQVIPLGSRFGGRLPTPKGAGHIARLLFYVPTDRSAPSVCLRIYRYTRPRLFIPVALAPETPETGLSASTTSAGNHVG